MKVLKFEIENYKALEGRHEIIPEGSSFFLVGANGQGKTSAGRALIDMMTKNHPTQPISSGEYEGYVKVKFDDQSEAMVRFEEGKKPKLTFLTPEGNRIATPKEFFEKMAGQGMSFDIDKFLSLAPKPRREMLEKMVGVDLSFLNDREAQLMEQARDVRRDHKAQVARVKPFNPEYLDREEVDVVELSEKIHEQKSLNREREVFQEHIDETHNLIHRLEKQLEEAKQDLEVSKKKLDMINEELVPEFQVAAWKEELEEADLINRKIREAKEMMKEKEQAEKLGNQLSELEKNIEEVRAQKTEAIKANPMPADGLEFDPEGDGLLLNGLPFEDAQIATSAKMIAALQIAEAQLGKIRYLHFDAAILDKENAMRVLEWAETKDLQLCLERPMWDGGALKMEVWDKTGEKVREAVV